MAPASRLRVLVTRPQPVADVTAQRLHALGHDPVVVPLTHAVNDPQAARLALRQPHSAIAVTSAQALRVLADPTVAPALDRQTRIFCVGTATAHAARALGFCSVVTGLGDGEGLARTILDAAPTALLYLAGNPRSPAFEAALARAMLPVRVCEIYRMVSTQCDASQIEAFLKDPAPRAVLLYSREATSRLMALVGRDIDILSGVHWLCLSPAIAAALPPELSRLSVAEKPDETSLLRLL